MKDKSSADWETAIVLPLGVVAGQLGKIEAQLRSLNMTAMRLATADGRHHALVADTQLDAILERLECIGVLVADIQRDLHPRVEFTDRLSIVPTLPSASSVDRDGASSDVLAERSRRRPNHNLHDRDD